MKNLRIAPRGIGELLAIKTISVPIYQRSYAWDERNVRNLLTDISAAIKRRSEGKSEVYFLGSIVVVDRKGAKTLEVVDGQQRLATISMILAAIRDYHIEQGKSKAAETYDQYLRYFHVPSGKYRSRLKLNEVDDRFFSMTVIEPPESRLPPTGKPSLSHTKIATSFTAVKDYVNAIAVIGTTKSTIAALYEIAEYIRTNVQVVLLTVDDEADAFTIFETLNDRHLNLTIADLLKNFLFGLSDNSLEEAKSNWKLMQGALQTLKGKKDRTVDFVRQLWGSMHGLVRSKDLFRDIKEKITDESDARQMSAALAAHAPHYVAVMNPLSEAWDGYDSVTRRSIETFNALRLERLRPLLLAVLRRFPQPQIEKTMKLLRSVAIRLVVTTGINGTIEDAIYDLAVKVDQKEIKNAKQLARAMTFIPNDPVFHATFATINISKAALARFLLRELEDTAKGATDIERDVTNDEKRVTLEHIIPLSAEERKKHWPNLSEELGEALCKRLGNQTLLASKINSSVKNDFPSKLAEYKKCQAIYLTSSIAKNYPQWGKDEVTERQKVMADLALERWPLEFN